MNCWLVRSPLKWAFAVVVVGLALQWEAWVEAAAAAVAEEVEEGTEGQE